MVTWPNLPKRALEDPFKPPAEPCRVRCIHCGQEYSSSEIVWRELSGQGFWCCPVPGCDGAGFGFDIFPLDSGMFDEDDVDEDEEP